MFICTDFTVIGGGIMGLLTARALNQAGASVTLIDKGELGRESSWAGGGILFPLYPWRQHDAIWQLVKPSLVLYPALAADLVQTTGIDPEWYPCGLLSTQTPDIDTATAWCIRHTIDCTPADVALLAKLATSPQHPLWLPHIAQIRNPRLVKALKQDLRQRGVIFLENANLTAIHETKQRIGHITINGTDMPINHLILSAGAWTSGVIRRFLPKFAPAPNIVPVKGQMLLFKAEPGFLNSIILDGEHYLIPRRDGHILAGSTVEHTAFDKATTIEGHDQIKSFAEQLLPSLKDYPLVKHWSGIRPATPNGVPYIGNHAAISNLSINAGHFRNGLAMAPASAQLMADLILSRPTIVDPTPYRLDRLV